MRRNAVMCVFSIVKSFGVEVLPEARCVKTDMTWVLNIFNLFGQQKIKQNLPTLGSTRCPGETAIPHSGPAWLDPQLPGARGYRAAVAG